MIREPYEMHEQNSLNENFNLHSQIKNQISAKVLTFDNL